MAPNGWTRDVPIAQYFGRMSARLTRSVLADAIVRRLRQEELRLAAEWQESGRIPHFVVDDVLSPEHATQIRESFPEPASLTLRRGLRERKFVGAQMSAFDPLLEEAVYAFQAPEVVSLIEGITKLRMLEPDELLYAGGISAMAKGHFLNPHLDNSHDKFRRRYRVLNLLYYVSPGWKEEDGGNLELWPDGPSGRPVTVVSRFNRLVVMATDARSWHSVSRNRTDAVRCCVSNYYFSQYPIGDVDYFQVTTFRGRPEQPLRDIVLRADAALRQLVRRAFPMGVRESRHYYERDAGA